MEIRNILVNLDLDSPSPALVGCAADLATRYGAELIGFAASEPSATLFAADGAVVAATWHAQERTRIEEALLTAEQGFTSRIPDGIKHVWRGYVTTPNSGLAELARRSDLILVGSALGSDGGYLRRVDVGELILSAGRPVLVAASGVSRIRADKIVVAWKDSREARRAVADALPFLKAASDVLVVVVDEGNYGAERSSLDDVVAWLATHGVKARGDVLPLSGGLALTVENAASSMGADLVVSGGYGHSRFREWLLGGMTQELLAAPTISRFFSN